MNYFYYDDQIEYPTAPPFGPDDNSVYEALKNMLVGIGLDRDNFGTPAWNPFKDWVKPGDMVLIKPNLVMDHNPAETDLTKGLLCMITHPSIVRFVFDHAVIALKGKGRIIVGDAPVQDCDFDKMKQLSGYDRLFEYMQNVLPDGIEFFSGDFRNTCLIRDNGALIQSDNPNRIFGETVVDLGNTSYFDNYPQKRRLRVTNYDGAKTVEHHTNGKNEYCVNSCVLEADVIFNLCKPKTHRIAGYTGAMKNLVGMNSRKEYLPHHTKGCKGYGGDEYSDGHIVAKTVNSLANDLKNRALAKGQDRLAVYFDNLGRRTGKYLDKKEPDRFKFGMWYQNDTIWRTILDLNHLVVYCDKSGNMTKIPQRRMIHIGDMVVSGEKEGPLCPSYKRVGGILMSDSAVEFDYILVHLMGFDPDSIPVMKHALSDECFGIDLPVMICSNDERFNMSSDSLEDNFSFIPTSGWKDILLKTGKATDR